MNFYSAPELNAKYFHYEIRAHLSVSSAAMINEK